MAEKEKKCDCGCEHEHHHEHECDCHDHECDCRCDFEDEIITLVDEAGNEIHFYEVATLERDGKYYACLEDADDEEADLEFFELVEAPEVDGETYYDFYPIDDEDLYESLFEQLQKEAGELNDECCCDDHECHCHDDK